MAQDSFSPREEIARAFRVRGLVQGVGFRPTVYRIAVTLNLRGTVFNDAEGVLVHLEGDAAGVNAFPETLIREKPPLARIDSIEPEEAEMKHYEKFFIDATPSGGKVTTGITADASICQACLEDMCRPADRRYRYAFTNCTHCGPRFTITRHLPYDRPQTSMAKFPMCPSCREEYEDPLDRRFHAQPVACPECGPELLFMDKHGNVISGDPIREAVNAIRAGLIVAVKGLGGFHLVCNAENAQAVAELRRRKHRDEKPLALMVAGAASAKRIVDLTEKELELLNSPAHPIVLARRRRGAFVPKLSGVADGLEELGVMFPYTPLHALLFHTFAGEPAGTNWIKSSHPVTLVMTSANRSGDPLVIDNDEALETLSEIADCFLIHNRDIVVRCDDSVVRVMDDNEVVFVRRARGWAPEGLHLPAEVGEEATSVVAYGPYLKNTAALLRGRDAWLTQHIGTLSNPKNLTMLENTVKHFESLFEVTPKVVACDAHPDFPSTRLAIRVAKEENLPLYPIYHHAAHIGVVMAEKARTEPTFGLALDGVGLGPNDGIWGGEALLVDATGFTRVGHLQELALPGGDKAAVEPWRMGAAILVSQGLGEKIATRYASQPGAAMMEKLIANTKLTGVTSSLGRWFDGVSSLLGLCHVQHDEATAAMLLEAAAECARKGVLRRDGAFSAADCWTIDNHGVLRLDGLAQKLLRATQREFDPDQVALAFENALSLALLDWVKTLRTRLVSKGLISEENRLVALTGGCLVNRTLYRVLMTGLKEAGLEGYVPKAGPAGDGALSLGQAWLARLAYDQRKSEHLFKGDAF
ncbi:MAG: carbamoyltransferase HypF [Sutterella wadsworthensis]|nr:carbamoyltransferase HypF [Sutterella wadsworthensis]